MRFAHISDLHFGSPCFGLTQFFSKRWLGNINYILNRKKDFLYGRLLELVDLFKLHKVTHVIVTGDLTVTSRKREFKMARRFFDLLKKEGIAVFAIPGNHDHYTKRSDRKKIFYHFFDPKYDQNCPFDLKSDKVTYLRLKEGLWLMGMDTSLSTSLTSSQGHFSPAIEENLSKALQNIPNRDKVILLNHFPFFFNDAPKKHLLRGTHLKNLLQKHSNVCLYMHGHSHRQTIADLRGSGLPIISDSGSTPHKEHGACHLFDFEDNAVKIAVYRYRNQWEESETHTFTL